MNEKKPLNLMVWIRCITGEFLDPKKITSISLAPCDPNMNEIEIFALYNGHKFLLHRTTLAALKKIGISRNQKKFQEVVSDIIASHKESKSISYREIFEMIQQSDDCDRSESDSQLP